MKTIIVVMVLTFVSIHLRNPRDEFMKWYYPMWYAHDGMGRAYALVIEPARQSFLV